MFFRLLIESFRRQRRRKMLAGLAILLGTTAVTAMLALATTIGDRIHKELAVYGANIVVYPKADLLDVKIGGVDVKPVTGGSYLKESDLAKLKTIFWANNITGISPELTLNVELMKGVEGAPIQAQATGYWFDHEFGVIKTGATALHPWWKLQGKWPHYHPPEEGPNDAIDVVVGSSLARRLGLELGDNLNFDPNATKMPLHPVAFLTTLRHPQMQVVGIVSTGGVEDNRIFLTLQDAQQLNVGMPQSGNNISDAISRVEISARTKPEDAFARVNPDSLSPQQREIWYCRPYANSIAYQIREAIPGSQAEQVRRVEQSEGNVLNRISGLMWLVSAAALLAAGFAVSAAMATAVLERRGEIGLMRSLGASKGAIALLFYAETGLLAIFAGAIGYLVGSGLAAWLGARIFSSDGGSATAALNPVLLPVVVVLALIVAIAGSTPSIRSALRMDPSAILREDA
jgi:putative ABC transport system permease protein